MDSRIPGRRNRSKSCLCGEWIPGVQNGSGDMSRSCCGGPSEREPSALDHGGSSRDAEKQINSGQILELDPAHLARGGGFRNNS